MPLPTYIKSTAGLVLLTIALVLTAPAAASAPAWVQHAGPVLAPSQHWEQLNAQEPSVVYDGQRFQMWYTAADEAKCMIGYATSTDGVDWVKAPEPVIGWGYGGVAKNACHSNVQRLNGTYYAWFSIDSKAYTDVVNGNLYAATSPDGVHWSPLPKPAIRANRTGWNVFIANTFVVRDAGRWVMFWESFGDGLWRMSTATSTDLVHWHPASRPLTGIGFGDTFGGPSIVKERRGWTMYFHAPPPHADPALEGHAWYSQIYEATSPDLKHWTTNPAPLVVREQPAWQVDQIADASVVVVNGRRLMFFDGLNNEWPIRSSIGLAILG